MSPRAENCVRFHFARRPGRRSPASHGFDSSAANRCVFDESTCKVTSLSHWIGAGGHAADEPLAVGDADVQIHRAAQRLDDFHRAGDAPRELAGTA